MADPLTRTMLLDLDGTLVDSVGDLAAALNVVLRPRGLREASVAETRGLIGNGVHALLAGAFAARDATPDDAALPDFLGFYEAHAADLTRPFPGVAETLPKLAAAGWRLAICTNKPEAAARLLLAGLGLSAWFSAIGGGDSFPMRKPDPGHLLATLHAAGGDPASAIMVGDHENDVRAAAGAGLPCVFARWGYGPAAMAQGAAATADSFAELPAIGEQLFDARRQPDAIRSPVSLSKM